MKQEIKPGVIIAVLGVLVVGIVAFFLISGNGGNPEKIDLTKIDPKLLHDEPPIRRGQPGYRERTTDH